MNIAETAIPRPPKSLVVGLRKTVFNATMRDARKAKALTLQDVALLVYPHAATKAGVQAKGGGYSQRIGLFERMVQVPPPDIAQEIADVLEVPLEEVFPAVLCEMPRAKAQEYRVPVEELRLPADNGALYEAIGRLSTREQTVISERFGLTGSALTCEAVGRELGVTRECVRVIEGRALDKLRESIGVA